MVSPGRDLGHEPVGFIWATNRTSAFDGWGVATANVPSPRGFRLIILHRAPLALLVWQGARRVRIARRLSYEALMNLLPL